MDAEKQLYDILNSKDIPAYHLNSFLDVDVVPEQFFIFNNLRTTNLRADDKIVIESLLYKIYFYSSSPVGLRGQVKSKIKQLEEAGFICGSIYDIGKIDRKFGVEFTAHKLQKF